MHSTPKNIIKISEDYFDYMARNYPVMCSSDEFYFFPRVKKSAGFLESLDVLDKEKIDNDISYLKKIKGALQKINFENIDLETQIDLTLLNQSVSTFLREFDEIKIWQIDPALYLKIILLGVDQILSRFSFTEDHIVDKLISRLAQIPRLLDEAKRNLKDAPSAYTEVALEVVTASIDYFKDKTFSSNNKKASSKEIRALINKTLESLDDFKRFLSKTPSRRTFIRDRQLIEGILRDTFSYKRPLEEIFEISSNIYDRTIEQLEEAARGIGRGGSWQDILHKYKIEAKDTKGLLGLYSNHIEKLEAFFKMNDIVTIHKTQQILVRPTPLFMKPMRASASYSTPMTDDKREPAYFYITANEKGPFSNLHNEYIFVTAHETYPGHHLLDAIRRRIANPIRQQIESPLFYEGWASYAERIIDSLGYVTDPIQKMVGLRRQAWRAVRSMLDVGIRINRLELEGARKMLEGLGYAPKTVDKMLRHYLLSPGYQLCYTIGKFEIDRLKERFSGKMGLKGFHDFLLEGGQIPFDLIEKRIEKDLCKKNS